MKNLILFLAFSLTTTLSFAQCEKNAVLKFDEIIEIRSTAGTPIKIDGIFTFSKNQIIMKALRAGREMIIESDIESVTACKWDTFLVSGRSEYKLLSRKGTEGPKDEATLILEGVNGELKITFRPPNSELHFNISESKIVQ